MFANGGSTPQDPIVLIDEQLLNQGFAAVKRPERKSPEAKDVVNVSAGTVALAVNRMSLLGQRDAAVESTDDWTGGIITQPQRSLCPLIWKVGDTSSNSDRQWNSTPVTLDSASLLTVPENRSASSPGHRSTAVSDMHANSGCSCRQCKEPEAKRRLGATAWQALTRHGSNLGCWQTHKGVVT